MSGFGGGGGSEMPIVPPDNTNSPATMANGIPIHTISMTLFPYPRSGSRSPSRQRGKRTNAYATMPTTTAKMTTITMPVTMVKSKIARACGDCGLRALTMSALNSAALASRRFTNARVLMTTASECQKIRLTSA